MKLVTIRGNKNSVVNCPGCGRPRGKFDLSHGECMEKVALEEKEGKGSKVVIFRNGGSISREAKRKSRNKAANRFYNTDHLPDYMF